MEALKLTEQEWLNSQDNELWFWRKQFEQDNRDQFDRNNYYMDNMEAKCDLIRRYVKESDFTEKTLMDLGSGPQGFMHVLRAKRKIQIDPLMNEFRKIGFDVDRREVESINMKAENIGNHLKEVCDVIFCLNSIDHHQDPQRVIENIYQSLKHGGDLILLTDMRTKEQCDVYHKLPLTEESLFDWMKGFTIIESQIFPHGMGNPIMQIIIWAKKI